jgi:hypothetical protein
MPGADVQRCGDESLTDSMIHQTRPLEAILPVDKSGRFYVVDSVQLAPRHTRFRRCSTGWRNQQLCRNLAHDTIDQRIRLVERFLSYTNEFPWTWTAAMVEEFFSDLRSISRRRQSTIRGYQNALRMFCSASQCAHEAQCASEPWRCYSTS